MINFNWYKFSELSAKQLYDVLALRADVFIVEQNRACLDPDGKDIYARHLLGMEEDLLAVYARLFPPTDIENHIVFGRVVTSRFARTKGNGKALMHELLSYCDIYSPRISIKCSAQHYLQKFYEGFGFRIVGEIYEEDDIPHIEMQRNGVVGIL